MPQVTATASYERTTGNFTPRPGAFGFRIPTTPQSFATFDFFNFGITATQLIYDFGQTSGKWSAAEATVDSLRAAERTTEYQVRLNVYTAFFQARAQQALVMVAAETLTNQQHHLVQIQGFVRAGTAPEIDLAQGQANLANARVQYINALNAYETSKAQLNQAMGVAADTDYEVADQGYAPVEGEDQSTDTLTSRALLTRPEIANLLKQREADQRTLRAIQGAYGPSLSASTGASEAGTKLSGLVGNWSATVTLTWPLLQGGLTNGQVHEARANLEAIDAQLDVQKLQIRLQVDQARLAVRAAKTSIAAARDAQTNAREQLRLAEGRYAAGVGNIIELSDAQVGLTNASAQIVQAEFNLASARAQLVTALGVP